MVVQCFESFSIIDIVDILFLVFLCEIFIRNTFFFALQCVIDDSDDGICACFFKEVLQDACVMALLISFISSALRSLLFASIVTRPGGKRYQC